MTNSYERIVDALLEHGPLTASQIQGITGQSFHCRRYEFNVAYKDSIQIINCGKRGRRNLYRLQRKEKLSVPYKTVYGRYY